MQYKYAITDELYHLFKTILSKSLVLRSINNSSNKHNAANTKTNDAYAYQTSVNLVYCRST